MSDVRILNISSLLNDSGQVVVDPQPGDLVRFYLSPESIGMVVEKIGENDVKVLWSNFSNPFENIASTIRRVSMSQIGQKLFTVQPMPQGALPFYLDMVEERMKKGEEP
jgi:hypothetical protein